jgi:transglutaminase-like putative cysteine protease
MQQLLDKWFADHFHGSALSRHTPHYNVVRHAADELAPLLAAAKPEARAALIERWYRDSFPGSPVDTDPDHIALVRAAVDDLKARLAAETE